jgi:hypothetical protein
VTTRVQSFFVDEAELVVRMIEAAYDNPRPPGVSAQQLIADAYPNTETVDAFRRAGQAAVGYLMECMNTWKVGDIHRPN